MSILIVLLGLEDVLDTSIFDDSSIFTVCMNMRLNGVQMASYIELRVKCQGKGWSSETIAKHAFINACLNTVGASSSSKLGMCAWIARDGFNRS